MKEGIFHFYFNKEKLKKLISIYGTSNKNELKQKIEGKIFDEKPKDNQNTIAQRLKNLKLQLECWKLLKEQKYSLKDSIEIIEGKKSISEPSLQLLQELPKNKQEEKTVGLDCNGYCGTCFHYHFTTNGICCRDNCNCGIRG